MIEEPDAADGANTQPSALPAFVKSDEAIPETDSPNDIPKVNDIAAAGDDGDDDTDAVGGSTSTVMVVVCADGGPNMEDVLPVTEFAAIVTINDPDATEDDESNSV